MVRLATWVALFLICAANATAAEPLPPGMYAGESEGGRQINMKVDPAKDGFRIDFDMDGAFVQRGFKPDPYGPGYIGMTSTMFSMFTGDVESQPLDGDQMLWTRQDGDIFIIYSMRIAANGHFSLWRYAFTPAENGLGLDIEMRRHGEETINDRAMLELQ